MNLVERCLSNRFSFLSEQVNTRVDTPLTKKIGIIAVILFGCLAAAFLYYQYLNLKKDKKIGDGLGGGSKIETRDIPFLSLRHDGKIISAPIDKPDLGDSDQDTRILDDLEEDIPVDDLKEDIPAFNKTLKDFNSLSLEEECQQIELLKKNWIDDPQKESQRILNSKILSSKIAVIKKLTEHKYQSDKELVHNQTLAVIGRVLEIKEFYQETHYVFTHGQALELSVANHCINEFVRKFTPRLYHPLKIPFRIPHTVDYSENIEEFFKKYNLTDDKSFQSFQNNQHNAEMISVDPYFWNTDSCESALHFFASGTNVNLYSRDALFKVFKSIFINYVPDETIAQFLAKKACDIAANKKKEATIGSLYAICVPKSIIHNPKINFAYRCHSMGLRCNCHPALDATKVLEKMQQNQPPSLCNRSANPQYRLLTSRLTEEAGVRSFIVDPLPKVKQDQCLKQIQDLVKEAILYTNINDMIENLPEGDTIYTLMDEISVMTEGQQLDATCLEHLYAKKGFQ